MAEKLIFEVCTGMCGIQFALIYVVVFQEKI
jgi:hypothetical protein